jgi:hypothetical protein
VPTVGGWRTSKRLLRSVVSSAHVLFYCYFYCHCYVVCMPRTSEVALPLHSMTHPEVCGKEPKESLLFQICKPFQAISIRCCFALWLCHHLPTKA